MWARAELGIAGNDGLGRREPCELTNLSMGGCLLLPWQADALGPTGHVWSAHPDVDLRLTCHLPGEAELHLAARAVWEDEAGAGTGRRALAFRAVGVDERRILVRAVRAGRRLQRQPPLGILVVDPRPRPLTTLIPLLQRFRHLVVHAATPLDCVVALERYGPAIQLAVVAPGAGTTRGQEILTFLTDCHPHVAQISMEDPDFIDAGATRLDRGLLPAMLLPKNWTVGMVGDLISCVASRPLATEMGAHPGAPNDW